MSDEPDQTFGRDEEGRFKNPTLSSARARRLNRRRWEKAKAEKMDDVASILSEGGFNPDDAPAVPRLLAETIAERGPRSVQAVREYLRMTRGEARTTDVPVLQGETCPLCHSYIWSTPETMQAAAKLFSRVDGLGRRNIENLSVVVEKAYGKKKPRV